MLQLGGEWEEKGAGGEEEEMGELGEQGKKGEEERARKEAREGIKDEGEWSTMFQTYTYLDVSGEGGPT